jgi:hypothetical protein
MIHRGVTPHPSEGPTMLRCALFAVAVCAIVPNTRAADPSGNWILSYAMPQGDTALCVVKVEKADGKPTATVAFAPKGSTFAVSDFAATDKQISFTVKQTVNLQGRQIVNDLKFAGTPGKDGKVVLGNIGPATAAPRRAKLTATDKTELEPTAMTARSPAANDYVKVTQLSSKPLQVQIKMQQEKDAEAKKGLQKDLAAAREEVTEKLPGLLRDVIAKHPDTVAAAESAMALFRNTQAKLTPDEAAKMADIVRKQSEPYGARFATANMTALAEAVASRKDVGPLALKLVEPLAKGLSDTTTPADQVKVLTLYKTALTNAGKADELKSIDVDVSAMTIVIDGEVNTDDRQRATNTSISQQWTRWVKPTADQTCRRRCCRPRRAKQSRSDCPSQASKARSQA